MFEPSVASAHISALPIAAALDALRLALRRHANVVLQAPPGAGKSTGVPPTLLAEEWLQGRKIVMLEPRRLAARAVAERMAATLGENVGTTIGYRTRLESRIGKDTRIEVVTEGILTRRLQYDAALEGVGLLIFDEFHERSLQGDLGLALSLDVQQTLREDLKILVMSATLDGEAVARLLHGAPIVNAQGRAFDVEVRWLDAFRAGAPRGAGRRPDVAGMTSATIRQACLESPGDILAFLPGQAEIHRTRQLLENLSLPQGTRISPLYGELGLDAQQAAIRPGHAGERKIVLATNIAETSLTIEGVRIVVDTGLARRARFDPATGMNRLETQRISRASASQRRGRAGRLAPGICYRLWTRAEHDALPAHTPAEILETDLAPLALDLAAWGIHDPGRLCWLDPPPAAAFQQARDLLTSLEGLDNHGRINTHGRALNRLGTHPRLAHMILRGAALGMQRTALEIAAVLGERDLLRTGPAHRNVDLRLRLEALRHGRITDPAAGAELRIDTGARRRALRNIPLLRRQLQGRADGTEHPARQEDFAADHDTDIGRLLAFAYPERVAQSRGADGRYLLANGRGAALPPGQSLARAEFLVVADLEAGEREASIRLAAPLERTHLTADFAARIEHRRRCEWDARSQAVLAQDEDWLGAIKLRERRIEQPDEERMHRALLQGIRELGIDALPWSREARSLQRRLMFARRMDVSIGPDVSDAVLGAQLEDWLSPWLSGMSRREHLARLDLHAILMSLLDWNAQQRLAHLAPSHLEVPSGSRIPIDYSGDAPSVAVRLQEVFGLHVTPTIAGRVPLTLQLLSPAGRPVQVTRDLASFWAHGYLEVKKELKGRYPKHSWPDDPRNAAAVRAGRGRR
ncbi:ATP-dependent helicase HrpB [Steroidobacter denitrificans]|uniref:ATP-dependent helicase HrpB n=2 Tax=Steroidobacter denitrificans TaxID=465721 RepID=A0A127FDX9_STEDE|nr:ATP-dependent helicase HrpB [Steroidobacter denitrificans]